MLASRLSSKSFQHLHNIKEQHPTVASAKGRVFQNVTTTNLNIEVIWKRVERSAERIETEDASAWNGAWFYQSLKNEVSSTV